MKTRGSVELDMTALLTKHKLLTKKYSYDEKKTNNHRHTPLNVSG